MFTEMLLKNIRKVFAIITFCGRRHILRKIFAKYTKKCQMSRICPLASLPSPKVIINPLISVKYDTCLVVTLKASSILSDCYTFILSLP